MSWLDDLTKPMIGRVWRALLGLARVVAASVYWRSSSTTITLLAHTKASASRRQFEARWY